MHPLTTNVHAVSKARYPRYKSHDNKEYTAISESLGQFFQQSMLQTLSDSADENKAYSPINLYLALCISAELSGGDTQILELLGAGAAMPPDESIDFVLDRPFLFVITNQYNMPLLPAL